MRLRRAGTRRCSWARLDNGCAAARAAGASEIMRCPGRAGPARSKGFTSPARRQVTTPRPAPAAALA